MVLYLAQAILLALGAAVVVFALRQRREQVPGASRDEAVAALYRQRLTELRGELTAGRVAEADRAQIEEELGAALLADIPSAPGTDNAPVRKWPCQKSQAAAAATITPAKVTIFGVMNVLHKRCVRAFSRGGSTNCAGKSITCFC